jgi:hypothetical protein
VSQFYELVSLLRRIGWRADYLLGDDACVCDVGVLACEEVRDRLGFAIANGNCAQEIETNFVALGAGSLRSGTAAGLSLHQEGYETPDPPRLLFLYCVESDHDSGRTTVASSRALLAPRHRQAVEATSVRFFRASGGWTPWRPVLEHRGPDSFVRFALPDAHRHVETQGPFSVDAIAQEILVTQRLITWRPGLLVAVRNWSTVHGREPFFGTARRLFRLVF